MNDMVKKRQQQVAEEGKEPAPKPEAGKDDAKPSPEPAPEPDKLKEDLPPSGECGVCGEELIWIKLNSRVRATVCNNFRCSMYRIRVKTHSLPPRKPEKMTPQKKSKKGGAKRAGTDNRQGSKKGSK